MNPTRHREPSRTPMRSATILAIAAGMLALACATSAAAQSGVRSVDRAETVWKSLRAKYFPDRDIQDGASVLSIEAPDQAEDAAIVPITIRDRRAETDRPPIDKLWLVIDNNPEPMSAEFTFGPAAASATLGTRVRVNSYTWVRVIAKTADGQYYMVKHYVRAAGGCSAPIGRDPREALKHMGEMRLREVRADDGEARRTQLLIRHPNITGLQMDQITRLVWPAHFVDAIRITRGDETVLDSSMTFSLSENPSLQFDLREGADGPLTAHVHDNKDNTFEKTWPATRTHAETEEKQDT